MNILALFKQADMPEWYGSLYRKAKSVFDVVNLAKPIIEKYNANMDIHKFQIRGSNIDLLTLIDTKGGEPIWDLYDSISLEQLVGYWFNTGIKLDRLPETAILEIAPQYTQAIDTGSMLVRPNRAPGIPLKFDSQNPDIAYA